MDEQKYFTAKEVAAILRVEPMTLWRWRKEGYGPACSRIGGKYLYSQRAITNFFNKNLQREAQA